MLETPALPRLWKAVVTGFELL